MSYTRLEIADMCRHWGTHLWVPKGIDGAKLMWGFSGNESTFGCDCTPRHEVGYCTGKYSTSPLLQSLTRQYGHQAHCSYGPWQQLLVNCSPGTSPQDMASLNRSALEFVTFINREILGRQKATTLEQIADAYNSGNWRDKIVPEKYIKDLIANYSVPMPA